jgi:Ion channel
MTASFLIKAWLKNYPIFALPFFISSFLLINAYVLYVVERNSIYASCYEEDFKNRNFNFKNCFWCCIISFLTVGYGDYYPTSILGRAMNTINIVGGMVSSATIIGLVHESMQLNHDEYHVFKFIKTRKKEV